MKLPQNIMIVEDEVLTQRFLKNILLKNDVKNIESYDNAQDVLRNMEIKNYDMILMDININGEMNGIELSKKILNQYTYLPIVFISAHNDCNTLNNVLELSPYGFICKPFSSRDIETTLELAYKRFLLQQEKLNHDKAMDKLIINERYTYSETMRRLYCDNKPIKLKKKHQLLVDILCKMNNKTVRFEVLINAIWEDQVVAASALRTLVYTLRRILPDLPIISYSKVGYSLEGA